MSTSVDIGSLKALRRKVEILRRQAELRRNYGLAFYQPHAKQSAFHAAADRRYRYARTGNRFGKSEMGAAEDCAFALNERIWLPKGDPMRVHGIPQRPTKGLIITTDWDKSTETFTNLNGELGKLFRFLPSDAVARTNKNHSGAIDQITLTNGSTIYLDTVKSFKQNPLGQESSAWDWIHVDEPCPREMFVANARGLVDRNGKAWFTCTPLVEVWINDFFVPSRRTVIDPSLPLCSTTDRWMITGSIHDNPYNSADAVRAFEAMLTADEIACRVNGVPLAMAGLVYKEFSYDTHVLTCMPDQWGDWNRPPFDYTIRLAIDPHPRTPHAVMFIATAPTGENFVYDEIFNPCLIEELCGQIKALTKGYFIQDALIDPIANTKNPITGVTMKETFLDLGVMVDEATKDLTGGILKVKSFLKQKLANGNPLLKFSPELSRTLYEFDHYLWDGATNKPIDKEDHMMEDLYRLCLTELNYVAPPTDRDYQPISHSSFGDRETFEDLLTDLGNADDLDGVEQLIGHGQARRPRSSRYPR